MQLSGTVSGLEIASIDSSVCCASSLMWLTNRGICPSSVQTKEDVPGCDLSLLQTADLLHLGLDGYRFGRPVKFSGIYQFQIIRNYIHENVTQFLYQCRGRISKFQI